jgi:hypothetical protein
MLFPFLATLIDSTAVLNTTAAPARSSRDYPIHFSLRIFCNLKVALEFSIGR